MLILYLLFITTSYAFVHISSRNSKSFLRMEVFEGNPIGKSIWFTLFSLETHRILLLFPYIVGITYGS